MIATLAAAAFADPAASVEGTLSGPGRFGRSFVVVYVDDAGPPAVGAPPEMAQVDQRFDPAALVVVQGQTVEFPNRGSEYHDVYGRNVTDLELTQYGVGDSKSYTFADAGVVELGCKRHSAMHATVLVVPNLWYAVADRDGHYALTGLPEGRWHLVVWSPDYEEVRTTVQVGPTQVQKWDVSLIPKPVELGRPGSTYTP